MGDRLIWRGEPVTVLEVLENGSLASEVAIRDKKKRVWSVRKEELCKPNVESDGTAKDGERGEL
jgi:hypothetical protein